MVNHRSVLLAHTGCGRWPETPPTVSDLSHSRPWTAAEPNSGP
jgi:hypothetical protein